MLECFDGYQTVTTRELSYRIKNCNSSHQHLKRMVKNGCARGNPEQLNNNAKAKIRESLIQTIETHRTLKEFFRPYLEPSAIQEIFNEDKIEALRQRNNKLKNDRASFEKQVWELVKTDEQRQLTFVKLQKRCQELEKEVESYREGDVETAYKRRQQQLEETLKSQNHLIEDLERRLSDSDKEKNIFKELNRNLQTELQKMLNFNKVLAVGDSNGEDEDELVEDGFDSIKNINTASPIHRIQDDLENRNVKQ